MGWLNQYFSGGKTTIPGDTLVADVAHFKTTGAITGTSVSDANGPVVARQAQVYQFPEQDISAAGATVLGPMLPTGGHITRAWYGVTETFGTMTTGAVQIGSATDVDAHVLGTTDEAHGLLTTGKTAGSYVALSLTGVEGATIAAGERLSVSHVQCAVAGALIVIVEYVLA